MIKKSTLKMLLWAKAWKELKPDFNYLQIKVKDEVRNEIEDKVNLQVKQKIQIEINKYD